MDCVIIRPPFEHTGFDQETQESMGAAYLLAALRERGFSACLLDGELQNLTAREIASAVNDLKPAVAGFSIMSEYALDQAMAISEMFTSESLHVTAGGYLPSFFPEKIFTFLPRLDSIVQFDGEKVLADLVDNALKKKPLITRGITIPGRDGMITRTEPERTEENLDNLPMPHRDALPSALKRGMPAALSSSRGCSGRCTFCSINQFSIRACGSPLRQRNAEKVLEEMVFLRRVYGVNIFNFIDDDFIGNREEGFDRAFTLGEMIKNELPGAVFRFECRPDLVDRELFKALKEAGLAGVFLGIDSSVEKTRNLYKKNCSMETAEQSIEIIKSLELDLDIGFIPFHPEVTFDEVLQEYKFLFSRNLDNIHTMLNRLYCTGESPLSKKLMSRGLLKRSKEFELTYGFKDSRVSLLHETASVALKPLFPAWYDIYKKRRQACDLFIQGSGSAGELAGKNILLSSVNSSVRSAIEEIIKYTDSGGSGDLLRFTRTIREKLKSEIAEAEKIQ